MRWLSLIAGVGLVAIAFGAATRVSNTREGLIAEVITLLAGLLGVSLVLFGLVGRRPPSAPAAPRLPVPGAAPTVRQFAIGAAGLGLAAILVGGSGISAGWQWAALSSVLLLPMIVGSAVLCVRFLRAR
ncbi:MAG: hypothetical protein NVS1B3_10230 [Candidatus Dormibacteraceae bacterium]